VKLGILEVHGKALLACERNGQVAHMQAAGPWTAILDVIRDWNVARGALAKAYDESRRVLRPPFRWLPPISRPPKFLLLAGNFRAHVLQSGFAPAPDDNLTPQFS
jgi:hypothetical protein